MFPVKKLKDISQNDNSKVNFWKILDLIINYGRQFFIEELDSKLPIYTSIFMNKIFKAKTKLTQSK